MNLDGRVSRVAQQGLSPEQQGFDYGTLDKETKIVVQRCTSEIKSLMRRTAQDLIDIGQKLIEVKQQLGHGNFEAWLKAEFGWGEWTARKFIQVARKFKSVKFTDLSVATSALYLLASSYTPEDACKEVLERAVLGDVISYTKAKTIVTQHQEAARAKESKAVTLNVPVETVVRDSSTPSETRPETQAVEPQSPAIVKQSKEKLSGKKTEVLAHSQLSNLSHDMAVDTDSKDYSLKDQTEKDFQSLSLVGTLIYFTDLGQQESKLLGQIAEVKEATATDVVIRISLQPLID